jgi:hypothetical protein
MLDAVDQGDTGCPIFEKAVLHIHIFWPVAAAPGVRW